MDTILVIGGKVDTVYRDSRKADIAAKLAAANVVLPKGAELVESKATKHPVCGGMKRRKGRFVKA